MKYPLSYRIFPSNPISRYNDRNLLFTSALVFAIIDTFCGNLAIIGSIINMTLLKMAFRKTITYNEKVITTPGKCIPLACEPNNIMEMSLSFTYNN